MNWKKILKVGFKIAKALWKEKQKEKSPSKSIRTGTTGGVNVRTHT